MGRWTTKSRPLQSPVVGNEASGSLLSCAHGTADVASNATLRHSGSATSEPQVHLAADTIAERAAALLHACSLSEEQCHRWRILCNAVVVATPSGEKTRSGPPAPEMLAALQSARQEREEFVEGLSLEQREKVKELLELEKQDRKQQIKDSSIKWKAGSAVNAGGCHSEDDSAAKKQQKDVMTRAFGLWQQDRKRENASSKIDSTEWKLIRAIGGGDPTLRRYLLLAGWDSSWPMPEPEGRLLRREGQNAAVQYYARDWG